ncbi:Carboxy-terminal domain (CTD) phosphatase [Xylographa trunciseda]|nr:Carboxy-terminal domain (CTD) phosphatase [Xylographa trunciseda]
MHLRLPHSLHYPITVTELLKQPNDNVDKFTPLFAYFYQTKVTEGDELGNVFEVDKTFPTRFESNVEGTFKRWKIVAGAVITHAGEDIAEIEELCAHGVQYGGMCVNCGKDMTEYAFHDPSSPRAIRILIRPSYRRSYVTNQVDASRAQINMIHDNVALRVSEDEATKVEEEAKRRLIASKKLSLVVDLDQTIIHATVDPTIADWQKDPENPNYEAVKDVRAFQLVDDGPGARGCWYYIKLRPGLEGFLESVSKLYELHIYTMGTRAYAQNIAKLIDPDRRIFGDRILSRDESGSLVAKNLQRLFPVDTKMVVIIDDRGDVWKWNENLIKVTPYDFFVGIGDINSSFLPKKPKLKITSKAAEAASVPNPNKDLAPEATISEPEPIINGGSSDVQTVEDRNAETLSAESSISALEQLVSMGGGDDPGILLAQASQQDEAIAAQQQDQPLLQKQKQLDAEDDAKAAELGMNGESQLHTPDSEKPHHRNLLHDDDDELLYLEYSLSRIHSEFFDTYTRQLADAQGGRLAELRGTHRRRVHANGSLDLDIIPDIKTIMPAIKARVLAKVVIVFSGVVPLGIDIQSSDIALWAKSFGAKVEEHVSRRSTTHVIAARNRTAKVRQAVRRGRGKIKIVTMKWLMNSISRWARQDETPYLLKTDDGEAGKPGPGEEDEVLSDSEELGSAFDTDGDTTDAEGSQNPKHGQKLTIKTSYATDDEDLDGLLPDDIVDEKSPVGGTNDDWEEMNHELEEFLGSDAEDSDADSVASEESGRSGIRSKRPTGKRTHDQFSDSIDEGSPATKKQSPARSTNLSQSQLSESGLATPDITAGEDVEKAEEDDDGWGDFEADLETELAGSEERDEG